MDIQALHHVAVNVRDLELSRQFYHDILGLSEIARPPFDFPGAWFRLVGEQRLHLIVHSAATFRGEKGIDTRDLHFAVRVHSYRQTVELLRAKGYREDAAELDLKRMKLQPHSTAGFPQIYICDPDSNVVEINAETLD